MEECSGIDSERGGQVMGMEGEPGRSQGPDLGVGRKGTDERSSAGELSMDEAPDAVPLRMRDEEKELGAVREGLLPKPLGAVETGEKEPEQEPKVHTGGETRIDVEEEECPICTEPYETRSQRGHALLNCDHSVCQQCLGRMLRWRADGTRVPCPLCRQRTPLLYWEIHRMQEEAVHLMGGPYVGPHPVMAMPPCQAPPPSELGLWAELERWLESRMDVALVCGCVRYPPGLVQLVHQLKHRCQCCYLAGLLLLYLAELSCLLLVFLPVVVLVLLFTLTTK